MKKLLPVVLVLAVYLTPLYPIYAQRVPAKPLKEATKSATPSAQRPAGAIVEKVLDRMEVRRERIASKSAALKARLLQFKDKTKAQRIEKINTNLDTINSNRTAALTNHLNRLSEILTKLETRANEAKGNGKDIKDIEEALKDARASINAAKEAVDAQAANEYTLEVTNETTVKMEATEMRDKLHNDLKAVRSLVKEARDSVAEAIRTAVATAGKEANDGGQ